MRQIWINGEHTDFTEDDDPPDYRIGTGGVKFDEDWPGYFMRGDDALWVASLISSMFATGEFDEHVARSLKIYADQIFEEVPYKQWIDEEGHSIIAPLEGDEVSVDRAGGVTRADEEKESEGDEE